MVIVPVAVLIIVCTNGPGASLAYKLATTVEFACSICNFRTSGGYTELQGSDEVRTNCCGFCEATLPIRVGCVACLFSGLVAEVLVVGCAEEAARLAANFAS